MFHRGLLATVIYGGAASIARDVNKHRRINISSSLALFCAAHVTRRRIRAIIFPAARERVTVRWRGAALSSSNSIAARRIIFLRRRHSAEKTANA